MTNFILKTFKEIQKIIPFKKVITSFSNVREKLSNRIKSYKYIIHIHNILILFTSYSIISIIIYPKFDLLTYIKEIFSIFCIYGAIFLWFTEKITPSTRFKSLIITTACFAPVLFMNTFFSIAIVSILCIILTEYIILKYYTGCRIFSDLIPIYVICDDISDIHLLKSLKNEYKILETILINDTNTNNIDLEISTLKSVNDIKQKLRKINMLTFFPTPRRIMYFSFHHDTHLLAELLELSSEFSIPVFKLCNIKHDKNTILSISPISFRDFEFITIRPQEKTLLNNTFKNKKVWIFFDGRKSILDLIYVISLVTSANITIFCESETLANELTEELSLRISNENYKIKISNLDLLSIQDNIPDILFYNMPIKTLSLHENNLKEALIKNVLYTEQLIKYAQTSKIKYVFIISSMDAVNARNWFGVTQRLGELTAQYADTKSKKSFTKFRIIRIPDCATDRSGIFGKIITAILSKGYINFDFSESETIKSYYRSDIIHPLLKLISYSIREQDFTSSAYTIIPKNAVHIGNLVKIACQTFGLQIDKDIKVLYKNKPENMDLENFPNITEILENTDIESVMRTKFIQSHAKSYDAPMWTIEEIHKMRTRDIIATVLQNLSEKIKKETN